MTKNNNVHVTEAQIDAWFQAHFSNNTISANEAAYELAYAAKKDLKAILGLVVTPTAEAETPAKAKH